MLQYPINNQLAIFNDCKRYSCRQREIVVYKHVSIIIVNYNGKHLLKECIQSILNQSYPSIEIILIDNASQDGSVELVAALFHDVKVVKLQTNTGFSGGNLEGLKYATGDYIMLINNDVVVDKDCISNLTASMEKHPDVGIGAAKILVYGKDSIDSAGDGFSTSLKGFKRGEGLQSNNYDKEEYIFGACAGTAIYRRSMIDEIGFFDDDFFLIHEDTDLNFRAQLGGWKVLYIPSAVVYHKVRSTIGNMSDTAVYYSLRNSELVRIKNIPSWIFLRCFPAFILGVILDFLYFSIKHRKAGIYLKAKIDAMRLLPKMLKKRKLIMSKKMVANKYIGSLMTPLYEKEFFLTKLKKLLYK